MEDLLIKETEVTPRVNFDAGNLKFIIEGVSRPEDVSGFYNQIIKWLIEFEKNRNVAGKRNIYVIFKMNYCNSASMKMITQILKILKRIEGKGFVLNTEWYYENGDEQMYEDGKDLSGAVNIPFSFYTF